MGLIEYGKDLYHWWIWEIGQMAGSRRAAGVPAAVLRVARDGVRIERPGSGGVAVTTVADSAEVGRQLRALVAGSRRHRISVDVLIEPDRYLRRPLSMLRLPKSRMLAMAKLDYSAATPFRPDECFLIIPEYREEAAASSYYIVRRAHLEPLLDGLRRARIDVRAVGLADEARVILADRDSLARISRPPVRTALAGAAVRWATATAAIGVVAVFGVLHWRYSVALDAVGRQVAAAAQDAAVVQRVIDERYRRISRIAAARSAKSEAVPLVRVLEELARTIPDGTWLTEVDFRETTVTFTGISDSAAALIPALESSPLFRAPIFSQQVVREADQGGERFTITMELEVAHG